MGCFLPNPRQLRIEPARLTASPGKCLNLPMVAAHDMSAASTDRPAPTHEPPLMNEIYISTDVETDGPIPGPHSMLSIGAAAYTAGKVLLSTFSANLETLAGAQAHPKTAEWWAKQPAAWAACRQNPEPPERAMARYVAWIKSLAGKPVFVAYPAAFDFMFVYWYLMKYVGESPFSHSALDIKSFAMAVLKTNYRESTKRNMPKRWFDELPHTHVALSDAIEQGALFCNMLRESRL
jgi:DNA polymerase III alpha subunit (gram-positive type)